MGMAAPSGARTDTSYRFLTSDNLARCYCTPRTLRVHLGRRRGWVTTIEAHRHDCPQREKRREKGGG